MTYKVELTSQARKSINKMDTHSRDRILNWLKDNIDGCDNPRIEGRALKGNLGDYWRYRVGEYRILAEIRDDVMIVLVIKVGNRNKVYRQT